MCLSSLVSCLISIFLCGRDYEARLKGCITYHKVSRRHRKIKIVHKNDVLLKGTRVVWGLALLKNMGLTKNVKDYSELFILVKLQ